MDRVSGGAAVAAQAAAVGQQWGCGPQRTPRKLLVHRDLTRCSGVPGARHRPRPQRLQILALAPCAVSMGDGALGLCAVADGDASEPQEDRALGGP